MMRSFSLAELQQPLAAALIGADAAINRVITDSRQVVENDLFVALQGERFDAHEFLPQVVAAGAAAAVVSAEQALAIPQLKVADTQRALGLLGAYNRDLFKGVLVAITGSSGKTTVKNLLQAVLSRAGETLATEGNFNNEIGVPLSLLRIAPQHQFAVIEMGAARKGDIDWLCQLGKPNIALLLNAMPAHLQGFGSVEHVAQAKGEIYDRLSDQDTAIINADQPWAAQWRERAGSAKVLDFAVRDNAAIKARSIAVHGLEGSSFIVSTPAGESPVRLRMPGMHNVSNALAAIAVGLVCEMSLADIVAALADVKPVQGRLARLAGPNGSVLIDDCYNANPGSVLAAIELLSQCEGRRCLMLGAMRELGERSDSLHREVGEAAREAGLEALWGVGEEVLPAVEAFGADGRHFQNRQLMIRAAQEHPWDASDTILLKGSRGAGMETVLTALAAHGEAC